MASDMKKFRFRSNSWEEHSYTLEVEVLADSAENAIAQLEEVEEAGFDQFNPGELGDTLDAEGKITLVSFTEDPGCGSGASPFELVKNNPENGRIGGELDD